MKMNQGLIERMIRVTLGAALVAGGYFTGSATSYLSIALMAMGIILIITGLVAYCPVWHMLGISTRPGMRKTD